MNKDISDIENGIRFKEIGLDIGTLVSEKNAAYGDSFSKVADFLKILWPEGIPVKSYTDALCTVRMFVKLMRIANKKDAFAESPYRDIAGYAILGIAKDQKKNQKKEEVVDSSPFVSEEEEAVNLEKLESDWKTLVNNELIQLLNELKIKGKEVYINTTGPLGEVGVLSLNQFGKITEVFIATMPHWNYIVVSTPGEFPRQGSKIYLRSIISISEISPLGIYAPIWTNVDLKTKQLNEFDSKSMLTLDEKARELLLSDPITAIWSQIQQAMDDQGVTRIRDLKDEPETEEPKPFSILNSLQEKAQEIQNWLDLNVKTPTADEAIVWQKIPTGLYLMHSPEKLIKLSPGDIVRFENNDSEFIVESLINGVITLNGVDTMSSNYKTRIVDLINCSKSVVLYKKVTLTFNTEQDKKNFLEIAKDSTVTPEEVIINLIDLYKVQTEEIVLAKAKEQNHTIVGFESHSDDEDDSVCMDHE